MSGDPHWSSVVLLCGFTGADGVTAFTDESPVARTLTTNGVVVEIDTAQSRFGGSSILLNGGSFTALDSADWTFTGQFTVECWVRVAAALANGTYTIMKHWGSSGARAWRFSLTKGTPWSLGFAFSTDGTALTYAPSGNITAFSDTWAHVAVDRDASDKLRLYFDGTMVGSQASAAGACFNPSQTFTVAQAAAGQSLFTGWLDEIRITKGVARYASDAGFAVPTAAFERGVFVPGPTGRAKVWTGSAWVLKPVKVWSGSSWVEKPLKVWNGSSWT